MQTFGRSAGTYDSYIAHYYKTHTQGLHKAYMDK